MFDDHDDFFNMGGGFGGGGFGGGGFGGGNSMFQQMHSMGPMGGGGGGGFQQMQMFSSSSGGMPGSSS